MKQLIQLFSLLLLSIAVPTTVNAENVLVDGIHYQTFADGTCMVSNGRSCFRSDIVIPSEIEYDGVKYPVTSIGRDAFEGCSGLTSLVLSNSVTNIGDYAFMYCSGLTSLVIPNSVTDIGNYVFYGCSGLTSLVIPNSVTSIGRYAFYGCSGLTSLVLSNSVTNIGDYAFM